MGAGASAVAHLGLDLDIRDAFSAEGSTTATETSSDIFRSTVVGGEYGPLLLDMSHDQRRMIDALDLNARISIKTVGWL